MIELIASYRKATGAVWHHALSLGRSYGTTEIGLARQTKFALATLGRVQGDHVIARLNRSHAVAHSQYDSGTLVSHDGREESFGILSGQRKGIRVAYPGSLDFHHNLPGLGVVHLDLFDGQWFASFPGNCGLRFHVVSP